MKSPSIQDDELLYHLQRSFTDGDSNYDAQLLYARQLFIMGDVSASRLSFAKLSKARISPQLRNRLLYPLEEKRFEGKITRMEASHAFLIRDGLGDTVFLHASNVSPGLWKNLSSGNRLSFSIAFTFGGANAFDIQALDFRAPVPDQLDLICAKERETAGKGGDD